MGRMREKLTTAVGSFGLVSAGQQLEKAWRELERCRRAETEDDLRDSVINCAIAIWHVNDWVWAAIAQGKTERPKVMALLGVSGRKLVEGDLVKWAVTRCPELEMVQSVCNASKHVGVVGIQGAVMVVTDADGGGRRPVIVDDTGAEQDALRAFDRAIDFWLDQATDQYVMH